MYGVYGDIIGAAERATAAFDETEELLEYPEVQADKAYYLSVLSQYNALKSVRDKLTALKNALKEESELVALISETTDAQEREAIYTEISALKRNASALSVAISDELGCRHMQERIYCRMKMSAAASKIGVQLYAQIKEYLLSRGAKIEDERTDFAKGGIVSGISFFAEGEDVLTRLSPLTGAHKVYISGAKSEELALAVTPASLPESVSEDELKIDVFHSQGAGGQNINKVETAVRITHLPTGLVVTCQDERSQLKNKKRALETLKKRLHDMREQAEKKRMEADIYAQFCKRNTPVSFDLAKSAMTDARLAGYTEAAFPLADFAAYINGLITL